MAYTNAIFYIDLYNGNDANRTALTGCIASNPSGTITRITKTAHGLVTGAVVDLTLFTSWLNGAWKITVVDADNFDLDGAVWQATADANGTVTPRGGSIADPWKTINSGATAARIAPGDTIRISKTPDPASAGMATWTDLSKVVELATAQTVNIELCETAWTASANVTATTSSTRKQGSYSAQIAIAAGFTTGKAAYKTLPAAIDLSGFQKLSFWLRNLAYITSGSMLRVCLCSDTTGDTVVDSFAIPQNMNYYRFYPLTLERVGGGNLGASIQSVAVYADMDPGSMTLLIDNIIACTATGLNLQSLISKNGLAKGGSEIFYGIQSINNTTILLDNETETGAASGRGYSGTSDTVETYIRETFKTVLTTGNVFTIPKDGALNNNIAWRGGYEIGTENQNGETYLDGTIGNGTGLYLSGRMYNEIDNIKLFRYYIGLKIEGYSRFNTFNDIQGANCVAEGINVSGRSVRNTFNNVTGNNNASGIKPSYALTNIFNNVLVNNNMYYGVGGECSFQNKFMHGVKAVNNGQNGLSLIACSDNTIEELITRSNVSSAVKFADGILYLVNASLSESSEITELVEGSDSVVYSLNHDGVVGNNLIYRAGALISWQTVTVAPGGTGAWKMNLFSSMRQEQYPLRQKIAEVPVAANKAVLVKAMIKKDHATDIVSKLLVADSLQLGISETSVMKADNTDWEEVSLSFTPTGAGIAEIFVEAYLIRASGTCYVAPITNISQS